MKIKIPVNWKKCATCSKWGGSKQPDVFRQYIDYDNAERGKCHGGVFNQSMMLGDASCDKWEQQYKN